MIEVNQHPLWTPKKSDPIPTPPPPEKKKTWKELKLCHFHDPDNICRLSKKPRVNGSIIHQNCDGRWWETCEVQMKESKTESPVDVRTWEQSNKLPMEASR